MDGWIDGLINPFLYFFSLGSEHIYTNTGSRWKKLLAILSGIFFLIDLAHLQVGNVTVCDHCLIGSWGSSHFPRHLSRFSFSLETTHVPSSWGHKRLLFCFEPLHSLQLILRSLGILTPKPRPWNSAPQTSQAPIIQNSTHTSMVGWIGPADLKSWKNNVHASSNVSLNSPITESLTKYLHIRSFVWRTVFLPPQSSVSPRINVQSHQHMGRTQRQTMKPEPDQKYTPSGPSHQQCHFACYMPEF